MIAEAFPLSTAEYGVNCITATDPICVPRIEVFFALSVILVVLAVIDNLVKGAAGQAVQNMNLLFNLPEGTALSDIGMLP